MAKAGLFSENAASLDFTGAYTEFATGKSAMVYPVGNFATPLLDKRPVPVTDDDKARMLQAEDLAETILFVARLPASVCINEILMSPTWNRGYLEGVKL